MRSDESYGEEERPFLRLPQSLDRRRCVLVVRHLLVALRKRTPVRPRAPLSIVVGSPGGVVVDALLRGRSEPVVRLTVLLERVSQVIAVPDLPESHRAVSVRGKILGNRLSRARGSIRVSDLAVIDVEIDARGGGVEPGEQRGAARTAEWGLR